MFSLGIGFIVLVVLELLVLSVLVSFERPFSATVALILGVIASDLLLETSYIALIMAQPWVLVAGFCVYVACGMVWTVPRWWFFALDVRDAYLAKLTQHKETYRLPLDQPLTGDELKEFKSMYRHIQIPPNATKNKMRIFTWMMYWPISLVLTMVDKPMHRAFEYLFERFKGIYNSISERVFRDMKEI